MPSRDLSALIRAVESADTADVDGGVFPLRLSAAGWAQLTTVIERRELRAGELLLRRGEVTRCAYLLESGRLQLFVTGGAPRSHRMALLGPGSMVGEAGLFAATSCLAHVEAATASVVWAVCAEGLWSLAPVAPALVLEVLRAAGVLMTTRRQAQQERGIPVT